MLLVPVLARLPRLLNAVRSMPEGAPPFDGIVKPPADGSTLMPPRLGSPVRLPSIGMCSVGICRLGKPSMCRSGALSMNSKSFMRGDRAPLSALAESEVGDSKSLGVSDMLSSSLGCRTDRP
mgnify:CR=1 FL=1